MASPTPTHITYEELINEIASGKIQIPQFQRDFVWELQQSAKLLDSILKEYPIGTFIFWKTKERLRSVKELGNENIPSPEEGDFVTYVLDGQQRLASLYAAYKGLEISRSARKKDNFGSIYINLDIDLENDKSQDVVTTDITNLSEKSYISFADLLADNADFAKTYESFPDQYKPKIFTYSKRFGGYRFPLIEVKDTPIDVATDIFTRINVGGRKLTVFEIMVAKTYDEGRCFDLSKKYKELIEEIGRDYETISGEVVVLQLIAMLLENNCTGKTILNLNKKDFIDTWPKAVDCIKYAIDHFRHAIKVPVSQLLPYPVLLVPFAYFFSKCPNREPTAKQAEYLENFFWRCSLSERYSGGTENKLVQDIKRIDQILNNESPEYNNWKINRSAEEIIDNGEFNTGSSFIKAILCIMASKQPRSFKNNKDVEIKNEWLKRSNSKNYHHFFPKGFLKEDTSVNNIVNITILDERTNKEIGKKAPSVYMEEYQGENKNIDKTMETHLIGDLTEFGIYGDETDDYKAFMKKRAEAISEEIRKRIGPK